MKKKLPIILCVFTILIICLCLFLPKDEEPTEQYTRNDKCSIMELSSGWYLFCNYQEVYNSDNEIEAVYCYIDGINLKYQGISDFNVEIVDKSTGEITGYITPAANAMCMSEEYKAVLDEITNYLKERTPAPNLTEDEINFVDTSGLLFNVKDIVKLYNMAMEQEVADFGKYMHISVSDIIKKPALGNYCWQVGYHILSGNIAAIEIEVIDDNGTYLSDKSEHTPEEQEIIDTIEKIEDNIIKEQSFIELGINHDTVMSDVDFSVLYTLLESIEMENNSNAEKAN